MQTDGSPKNYVTDWRYKNSCKTQSNKQQTNEQTKNQKPKTHKEKTVN